MRLIDADALFKDICDSINEMTKIGIMVDGEWLWAKLNDALENAPTIKTEPQWTPCSERLPEENVAVNITWVNHDPVTYYKDIKDKPFTATGVYFKGKWYWYSSIITDLLSEYGRAEWDEISEETASEIEVIAWMPLPEPYEGVKE